MVMMMVTVVQELNPQSKVKHCLHCHNSLASLGTSKFYCHGCESAYDFIHSMHLDDYYRMLRDKKPQSLLDKKNIRFDYLDHEGVQNTFCEKAKDDQLVAHLFLENVDCYACTWVCDQAIAKKFPGSKILVNLADQKAAIHFDPKTYKLSDLANLLDSLGYAPSPNRDFQSQEKSQLLRMGIAFFCLMNVMLLSTAEYLGSDLEGSSFYHLFRYISLGLAVLALAYPALPFYSNSLRALRKKQIHLDIPIALALLSSFAFSTYNTIMGSGPVYFDSMLAIIFLLLVGRYVQSQALHRHHRKFAAEQNSNRLARIIRPNADDEFRDYSLIETGERLRVLPGDLVPVNGKLLNEDATLNLEFLSGEQELLPKKKGEEILSGSMVCDHPIQVEALEDGIASELYLIESSSSQLLENKGQVLVNSEKIATFLVLLILAVSGIIFWYHYPRLDIAISRSVATLLIACPCAFGLGAPLIIARALQLGLKGGILFRTQKALEVLPLVKRYYFDKTGTLTKPSPVAKLSSLDSTVGTEDELKNILFTLNQYSNHHMAKALSRWAENHLSDDAYEKISYQNFKEDLGQGTSFGINGTQLKVGRPDFSLLQSSKRFSQANCVVSKEGRFWAAFDLDEELQAGARELIEGLQKSSHEIYILSGDQEQKVSRIAQDLQFNLENIASKLRPSDKLKILNESKDISAMVGNGLNDSMAMAASQLSITVPNASEQAKANADLLLLKEDLQAVNKAIAISHACSKAFRRSFAFAIAFNIIGISLGASGVLSPLVAAIFMPISSLTILYLSTNWEIS